MVCRAAAKEVEIDDDSLSTINRRGPDLINSKYSCNNNNNISNNNNNNKSDEDALGTVWMHAGVLTHLRSSSASAQQLQPLVINHSNDMLVYNGEIFAVVESDKNGNFVVNDLLEESDTRYIGKKLAEVANDDDISKLMDFISSLRGPWAIIFFHAKSNSIIFGRDFLGRRSLCISSNSKDDELIISSTPLKGKMENMWTEVEVGFIFRFNIRTWKMEKYQRMPLSGPCVLDQILDISKSYTSQEKLFYALDNSVRRRVLPHMAILFSGGLDSVVLAALAHRHIPVEMPIELINVSFNEESDFKSSDRQSAHEALLELQKSCDVFLKGREFRLICVNVTREELSTLR